MDRERKLIFLRFLKNRKKICFPAFLEKKKTIYATIDTTNYRK